MLNAAKNFLWGFLSIGLVLTLGGYGVNTFVFGGNWLVIAGVFIAYLLYTILSSIKANRHMSPDAAVRDFFGDIIVTLISFALALAWTLLAQRTDVQIGNHAIFSTNLVFLWGMFGISLTEQLITINLAAQQLYRIGQVTTESPT